MVAKDCHHAAHGDDPQSFTVARKMAWHAALAPCAQCRITYAEARTIAEKLGTEPGRPRGDDELRAEWARRCWELAKTRPRLSAGELLEGRIRKLAKS